jgi:hypothetical protein
MKDMEKQRKAENPDDSENILAEILELDSGKLSRHEESSR